MKTRICFFSGDITRSGGTERVASHVANALSREDGFAVCFLSLVEQQKEPFYPIAPGIQRHQLGTHWVKPGPGYLPLIGRLRRFLKEKQIDVIIDIDIVLDVLSLPAAKGLGTKVVSWEHFNADFELSSGYRKWILQYSVKRSDYVVVLTKGDLNCYRQRLGRRERIVQIYNPIDRPDVSGAKEREKQILSIGRLAPEKGMDKLALVAEAVLTTHPDWQWLLLGEGEERRDLERFIAEHHLENRLILMGNVPDVDQYLRHASILVSTSEYEGLGMNLLEARRMGVPCVSFAVESGPVEIIRDGIDGFLVQPFRCDEMARRIEALIRDPALREQFGKQGLASMDAFETSVIIEKWKCLLEQLTNGSEVEPHGEGKHYRASISG